MRHRSVALAVLGAAAAVSLTACTAGALGSTTAVTGSSGGPASTGNSAASAARSASASSSSAAAGHGQPSNPTSMTQGDGGGLPGSGTANNDSVQTFPAAGSCHYRVVNATAGEFLPDPTCNPGAVNPTVTQADIQTTICRSGYTSSIRPPVGITDREKALSAAAYGYTGSFRTAELDHIVSLELGGASNDARNLFIEPNRTGATSTTNPKDSVENALHAAVCSGRTSLSAAQDAVASNWTTALPALGLPQVKALGG
jgi:hypothetical protein